MSDSIVAQFVEDRRKRTLSVRNLIGAQNSGVIDKLAQNYSVEIAPKINVNSDQLQKQIAISREGSNLKTTSPALVEAATTKVTETNQGLFQNALYTDKVDPTSVFNLQTFSRGFGSPSITNPRLPKIEANVVNEVDVGFGGKEYSSLFTSAVADSGRS